MIGHFEDVLESNAPSQSCYAYQDNLREFIDLASELDCAGARFHDRYSQT